MLPIAIVTVLTIMAVVLCFIKDNNRAKLLAMAAHIGAFALCIALLAVTADGSSVSVVFGAEPWNFYVMAGPLDAFMVSLFVGVNMLIMWASLSMIDHDIPKKRVRYYYALMCVLIASLCGIVIFENFFSIFLMVEISSFAAVGIIIVKNKRENMRAGLKYLTLSIFGSSFILMGIIIFYFLTGSLSLTGVYTGLLEHYVGNESTVQNAFIFITIGAALKSALFPLHIWLPDAHSTAPSPSSAVLSSLVIKSYMFLYVKVLYKAIGADILQNDPVLSLILFLVMLVGGAAMLSGSFMAILQTDIKRMIAYSSVAQIGYIFLGIGMGTRLGLFAAMFHILAHAVTKAVLFLVAGSIIEQTDNRDISKMRGLGGQMRITMALFTVGSLSMIGIPLFVGFNSKWFFATGMIDAQLIWLLAVLLLSSLLNGCYYLPIVIRAFFAKSGDENEAETAKPRSIERPVKHLMPIIVLAGLVVVFAVFSGPINSYIHVGINSIW
jgi:multicomponent Na+:H+ antiporter subunit D